MEIEQTPHRTDAINGKQESETRGPSSFSLRLNRTIFGVGVMITGAILYGFSELTYTLVFVAPNTSALGRGLIPIIAWLLIMAGFCIGALGCKKNPKKY